MLFESGKLLNSTEGKTTKMLMIRGSPPRPVATLDATTESLSLHNSDEATANGLEDGKDSETEVLKCLYERVRLDDHVQGYVDAQPSNN